MNLAKLNHILIPYTAAERDRLRRSWVGKLFRPVAWLYGALSTEGRVLAVLLLFLGAAAVEVATTQVYLLWSVLCGLLVASLAIRPLFRLRKLKVELAVPERVSVDKPLTMTVVLGNEAKRAVHGLRLSGPFLPWDGRWLSSSANLATVAGGKTARLTVRARFVQRGTHHLDPLTVATLLPLGLATGPAMSTGSFRFTVVPRITPVTDIALPLGQRYQPGGVAQASRTGEAMELYGLRPYRYGDRVRDLHARTWARTGKPFVRQYQQEYFTRIGVILDNDEQLASARGLEGAISLAAGVVARLSRGEALIDLLVVDWEIHRLTIGRSLGFLEQALDLLADVQPGPELELDELVKCLQPFLAQLSCVVLITETADSSRRQLADRIRSTGVGCRVLRITEDEQSPAASERDELLIPLRNIDDDQPLVL